MRVIAETTTDPTKTGFEDVSLLIGLGLSDLPAHYPHCPNTTLQSAPYILLHAALATAPWISEVVSPLVGDHFDAMDLAAELNRAGFTGIYTVIVPTLPRPQIIKNELGQMAPDVEIHLIERKLF